MVINEEGFPELEPYEHFYAQCDCHGEAISIEPDYEFPTFYMAYWQQGLKDYRFMKFKEKLRWCWHILTKESPYNDQVCLSADEALRMCRYILYHYEKMRKVFDLKAKESKEKIEQAIKIRKEEHKLAKLKEEKKRKEIKPKKL